MPKKSQTNYMVYSVLILEWILTIGIAVQLILSFEGMLRNKTNFSDGAIILIGLFFVASIIFHIGIDFILTRGVLLRSEKLLFIWTIIQYGLFVLTFPVIILSLIGYFDFSSIYSIVILVSLFYRVFILKVITDLRESISRDDVGEKHITTPTTKDSKKSATPSTVNSSVDATDGSQGQNGTRITRSILRGSTRIKAMNVPPPPPPVQNNRTNVSGSQTPPRPRVPPRPPTLERRVSEV